MSISRAILTSYDVDAMLAEIWFENYAAKKVRAAIPHKTKCRYVIASHFTPDGRARF